MTRLPNRMPPKKGQVQPKPAPKLIPIDMATRGDALNNLIEELRNSEYFKNESYKIEDVSKAIESEINSKSNNNKIQYNDLLKRKIKQIQTGDYEVVENISNENNNQHTKEFNSHSNNNNIVNEFNNTIRDDLNKTNITNQHNPFEENRQTSGIITHNNPFTSSGNKTNSNDLFGDIVDDHQSSDIFTSNSKNPQSGFSKQITQPNKLSTKSNINAKNQPSINSAEEVFSNKVHKQEDAQGHLSLKNEGNKTAEDVFSQKPSENRVTTSEHGPSDTSHKPETQKHKPLIQNTQSSTSNFVKNINKVNQTIFQEHKENEEHPDKLSRTSNQADVETK